MPAMWIKLKLHDAPAQAHRVALSLPEERPPYQRGHVTAGSAVHANPKAGGETVITNGFVPMVVRDAVGDRAPGPHEANLFDLQAKYAEVVSLAQATDYLATIASLS